MYLLWVIEGTNEEIGKSIPHTILETITKKTDISLEFLINGKDLLKDRNETILKSNTILNLKQKLIMVMVITARIPLFKYIGA